MYAIIKSSKTPHQQKVITEANEIGKKVYKINEFISLNPLFKVLGDLEQARLLKQSGIMFAYYEILKERISAF
jgi:hypothetical protein